MDKTVQQIKDVLSKNDSISIAVGKNPTQDEMAAALSLYLSLASENKKVSIACPTNPIVELSNLVGINKVKTSLGTDGGDLVVSFPYKEGEIDKVSYTLEEGYLNIIVKAGEAGLSFTETDVNYKRAGGHVSALFIIGTPRLSDLGNLFNPQALKETTIINIDNKAENQGFGEIVLVSPSYSSVSEQISKLILDLNLQMDVDIAQNLLSGISFATENFQHQNTSSLAFEMVGVLMRNGASRNRQKPAQSFPKPMDQSYLDNPANFPKFDEDYDDFFDVQPPKPNQNWSRPQNAPRPANQVNQNKPKPFQSRPVPTNPYQNQSQVSQNQVRYNQNQSHSGQNQPKNPTERKDTFKEDKKNEDTPPDWLTPKIYKGSSSIE
ncbi:MAG: hypothetical protein M1450_03075 [Patescibacteria group bacterium]|nr:hypothetical protein [Patescibacteria group bacterium]